MEPALARLLDRMSITDCITAYMRGQDRLDAPLQQGSFHDDAQVDYGFFVGSARDFVALAQSILQGYHRTHHLIGQMDIDVEGDVAFGEVYFVAWHRRDAGQGLQDLVIAGRYADRYERRDGVWKIAHRREIVDWTRTDPAADDWLDRTPNALLGGRMGKDPSDHRMCIA